MKRFFVPCLVIAMMVTCGTLQAQDNVVKINILSPIVRTLNVSYEHAIKESSSFQLGVLYTGVTIAGIQYRGFGITPEYRFYFSSTDAPNGFYVGPFLRYQNVSVTEDDTSAEATLSSFGGGAVVGRQWIFKERISLDLFIGPSYGAASIKAKSGSNADEFDDVNGAFSGFGLRAGVTLGYAF